MKKYVIYKFTNNINGKNYIGKTNNFERRKLEHLRGSKNPNKVFHYAIKKYGIKNFSYEILFNQKCSKEWIDELEKYFIYFYDSFGKFGYNMTVGGDGYDWSGRKHSEESKIKMSKTKKELIKNGDLKPFNYSLEKRREIQKNNTKIRNSNGSYLTGAIKLKETIKNYSEEKRKQISEKLSLSKLGKCPIPKYIFILIDEFDKQYRFYTLSKLVEYFNLSFNKAYRFVNKGKMSKGLKKYKNNIKANNCENKEILKYDIVWFKDLINLFKNKKEETILSFKNNNFEQYQNLLKD